MLREPWSDIGRLQNDVRDISYKINQCAQSHELHQTNSNVDSLEHQNRETCSIVNELRSQLQEMQENIKMIQENMECMVTK